ncbi:hypothetical protein [Leifsonia sp. Leaf264]|uniref:hypothetical protein n=1 Tax=Leifsonia sp. Leaf264 TaxID=1736314 RepID=UPI0006F50363|nr:hypothetical protein [Leifsonia sp. Leaf264]KQO98714.1 hypothetical protein ASF30_11670 [Leifsonia sp. Leaf264]
MPDYDLVAFNWGDVTATFDDLVNRLDAHSPGAVIDTRPTSTVATNGEVKPGIRVTLNPALIRNTHAHDISCRLGFITHAESGDQRDRARAAETSSLTT